MKYDLLRLLNNIDDEIVIDEVYTFDEESLKGTDIMKPLNVSVRGNLTKDNMNNIIIDVDIEGIMILPCSITLKEVEHPFCINVCGNVEEMLEEIDEIDKKIENTLDILPIIWENILMEIPSKVVSPDAENVELSGDGWKLIKEEERKENPELAKLKDLL